MKRNELLNEISQEQIDSVLNQYYCELDYEFLGFIEIYKNLAQIIQNHFTIIDLGCYCAAQAFYFKKHRLYVGVDTIDLKRFSTENTIHYQKSIQDFILDDVKNFNLEETFAICSYVPDYDGRKLVRETFENLFVFYPYEKIMLRKGEVK